MINDRSDCIDYGGAGADYLSYVVTVEELSRVDASIGTHCPHVHR